MECDNSCPKAGVYVLNACTKQMEGSQRNYLYLHIKELERKKVLIQS